MARRKRYKEIDQLLTKILIGEVAVFALYLLFAGLGVTAMKVITAIIVIIASGLSLGFLYLCGEFKKRRSRWLVLGYTCTLICLLVSLVLNYPSPKPEAAETDKPGSSVSSTEDTSETTADAA